MSFIEMIIIGAFHLGDSLNWLDNIPAPPVLTVPIGLLLTVLPFLAVGGIPDKIVDAIRKRDKKYFDGWWIYLGFGLIATAFCLFYGIVSGVNIFEPDIKVQNEQMREHDRKEEIRREQRRNKRKTSSVQIAPALVFNERLNTLYPG